MKDKTPSLLKMRTLLMDNLYIALHVSQTATN